MSRISREQLWMDICEVLARRATCFRGNSGSMIVRDRDVISTAYNGPATGEPHCKGAACELTKAGGCQRSIHAEANALNRALAKVGRLLTGCEIYTLHAPCASCADLITQCGIKQVFYRHPYRLREGLDMLMEPRHRIEVFRVTPSGIVINERSNDIIRGE